MKFEFIERSSSFRMYTPENLNSLTFDLKANFRNDLDFSSADEEKENALILNVVSEYKIQMFMRLYLCAPIDSGA